MKSEMQILRFYLVEQSAPTGCPSPGILSSSFHYESHLVKLPLVYWYVIFNIKKTLYYSNLLIINFDMTDLTLIITIMRIM